MAIKTDSLESLCELIVDCPHSTPKWTDHGVVVLRNQNIRNGTLDLSDPSFTNEEDYQKRIKRAVPQAGDIVFTREAPMGEVCLVPNGLKCCLGQRQVLLRPRKNVSGEYLFWALQSPSVQHQISWNEGTGTTVSNVRIPVLKSLQIPRHPQDEAKAASMLSALANKIQLNRQTNQTLEAMAQALFKSWFVDFDPVIDNALAAGHEIPPELQARAEARKSLQARAEQRQASLSGDRSEQESGDILPESIRQLFPNRFVLDAQMGWIPEGWEVAAVSTALSVNPRVTLPKGTVAKYVDMKALPTSGYSIGEVIEKSFSGGAKFELHDVLLARITPCLENGKTGFVDFLNKGEVGFGSTEFIVLRQKGHIHYAFVACLAREESFRQHCIQNMVGSSGRQRVQNSCFDSFCVALPSEPQILALFEEQVQPMFAKKSANKNEIIELAKLRDTLLPKLISGELRLPEPDTQPNTSIPA